MGEKRFPYFSIREIIIYLVERFCPFNVKYFQILVGIVTTIILSTVLILGWMSSKKVKEVAIEDFNEQQLVLAQNAARHIESSISLLKREIFLLSLSPSVQYFEKVFMGKRIEIAFSRIRDEGGLEIRFVEGRNEKTHIVNTYGYQNVYPYPEDLYYLEWARQKGIKAIS